LLSYQRPAICPTTVSKEMPSVHNQIESHILRVRDRIRQAESRYGRVIGSVSLLAVSKTQPIEAIQAAMKCEQMRFGESYVQDALPKISALPDLEWHFIGPLQSNKCKQIAPHFNWVHSIEREKTAALLSSHRLPEQPELQVCLQVNISGEASKSGVPLQQAEDLALAVASLPRLRLRGLMTIPRYRADERECRQQFAALRELAERLRSSLPSLDTLSMGMSNDLEWAIAEGSTIVRVGSDIFGPRQ